MVKPPEDQMFVVYRCVINGYSAPMTRSTKAALLSGLIFPGVGHLVLKYYLRGSLLLISALVALYVLVDRAVQRALTIVDRINSGDIPLEVGAISEAVANSASGADPLGDNAPVIVFGICWLVGIIDSYRRGLVLDRSSGTAD